SRRGKYICWATPEGVFYRETASPKQENVTKIVINDAPAGKIKGFHWDDKETKVVVAIQNKLFVYELATKQSSLVAKVDDEKAFIAEPHWHGDEIVYSVFSN